ncbi:TrkA family potassium uptake protein [Gloeocapsa sp. PCC 73106]|uniref:potassium channel family protein n=1 Tax=Gloeocapsa sp. PCC 73106 TaxID=102232 RepID=UPI0002AC112C|nr:NAD-binding protein [Gloeocapsa sp. PCC 73106]ELR98195.1 K+ transport system, NAD-binding component [Gloeocapsa sp. PCC 73106]
MSNFNPLVKNLDFFLVCGLGSLGQNCVVSLKDFGCRVIAIEQQLPKKWEISNLVELLDDLIIGDCRDLETLLKAKIKYCRSILIVTSNEEVNAETAIAARELNQKIRIIMRSSQENLNELLSQQLGNFFADEPARLTALAFALAGLGNETVGIINLNGERLQVVQRQIKPEENWSNIRKIWELNNSRRLILAHYSLSVPLGCNFHQWNSEVVLRPGDTLVYLEILEEISLARSRQVKKVPVLVKFYQRLVTEVKQVWRFNYLKKIKSIAIFSGIIVLFLLLLGTFLFDKYSPKTNWLYALYATTILLLGGYADLFGDLEPASEIPALLQLFALTLTLIGTVFVGILYALITENLLSSKFELVLNRPAIPTEGHLILVGLGKVGKRVTKILQDLKESVVAVSFNEDIDRGNLPNIPLVVGNLQEALVQANFDKAKSVIITTDNEMLNLEIALTTRNINPESYLVIGTYKKGVSYQLTRLLSDTQIIAIYSVAAEAFAGAAFGENILSLFRHNNQTVLTTEYRIEAGDTLNSLLISEINYGYEVVVVLHQSESNSSMFIPSEDIRLMEGDRIVLLATVTSLQRIEKGDIQILSRCWEIHLEKALYQDAIFDGGNIIALITGCKLALARELMSNLPQVLPIPLYQHQGERLVRALKKVQVQAYLTNAHDT